MGSTTVERLSVVETKVDDLSTKFSNIESKVDKVLDAINKGNFDKRISRLENLKWLTSLLAAIAGAVITFLIIDFFKSPGI